MSAAQFALKAKKGYNLEVAGRAAFICVSGATTWLSEKMGVSPIFFWFGRLCTLSFATSGVIVQRNHASRQVRLANLG
ncbi:hypothetical protein [Paraburkholderia eburnea]|uniref:hypothetical protein n=1 Tax=Paraburkholderia eburnea TaxID=1189126 RepID=UPI0011B0270F|nr:hypothetical protein [Paraburkholderia eburnea]